MGNLLHYLNGTDGLVSLTVIAIISVCVYAMVFVFNIRISKLFSRTTNKGIKFLGRRIRTKELKFGRDYEIGLISKRRARYRMYRLMNDLTIDLGLKVQGVTPYELLFLLIVVSILVSMSFGVLLFSNIFLGVVALPIVFSGIVCGIYTKANLAHDRRVEAVIEAENIICNNIQNGVVVAVAGSFNALPKEVKNEFKDFMNNIDDMTYIATALLDLNNQLGSISDDFIQRCIKFELEEEHGTAGTFQDVVEINNYKVKSRMKLKRVFERIINQFVVSALIIAVFLFGTMALYEVVYTFYFKTTVGQVIILLDMLALIGEFVYITYLRAQNF